MHQDQVIHSITDRDKLVCKALHRVLVHNPKPAFAEGGFVNPMFNPAVAEFLLGKLPIPTGDPKCLVVTS